MPGELYDNPVVKTALDYYDTEVGVYVPTYFHASALEIRFCNYIEIKLNTITNNTGFPISDSSVTKGLAITIDNHLGNGPVEIIGNTFSDYTGALNKKVYDLDFTVTN